MQVKLVSITPEPEKLISFIARVSNPDNQDNPDYAKLIKFLIKNQHWSPFEHSFMTVEIKTSRAIATQILRHRSFSFQEFSQRYSEVTEFEPIELRKQATKNRQSSLETINPTFLTGFFTYAPEDTEYKNMIPAVKTANEVINDLLVQIKTTYNKLLELGVAKEVARMILPLTTQTTLYMSGSIRSWIHYIQLRDTDHVQKEHRMITQQIRGIFNEYLPTVAIALAQIAKDQSDKELLGELLKQGYISFDNGVLKLQEGIYATSDS